MNMTLIGFASFWVMVAMLCQSWARTGAFALAAFNLGVAVATFGA